VLFEQGSRLTYPAYPVTPCRYQIIFADVSSSFWYPRAGYLHLRVSCTYPQVSVRACYCSFNMPTGTVFSFAGFFPSHAGVTLSPSFFHCTAPQLFFFNSSIPSFFLPTGRNLFALFPTAHSVPSPIRWTFRTREPVLFSIEGDCAA